MIVMAGIELSHRAQAVLRAVRAGRAEVSCSRVPNLRVDGLSCCDQMTVHELVRAGLISAPAPVLPDTWVPASLTTSGVAALADAA